MLAIPVDRSYMLDELATLTPSLTRQYAILEPRTLKRDLKLLERKLELVERDEDGNYRANVGLLQQHCPQRRDPSVDSPD